MSIPLALFIDKEKEKEKEKDYQLQEEVEVKRDRTEMRSERALPLQLFQEVLGSLNVFGKDLPGEFVLNYLPLVPYFQLAPHSFVKFKCSPTDTFLVPNLAHSNKHVKRWKKQSGSNTISLMNECVNLLRAKGA